MSYDLTFLRVPSGMAPSLAHETWAEEQESFAEDEDWLRRPLSDAVRTEMRTVAEALKAWWPKLEEFHPTMPLPWIELTDHDLLVQFGIWEDSVSATMPYFGENIRSMIECLIGSIAVLRAAGYTAYDPQLGRAVTAADMNEMIACYEGVTPQRVYLGTPKSEKSWWKFW